jgi:hypothetical protein
MGIFNDVLIFKPYQSKLLHFKFTIDVIEL